MNTQTPATAALLRSVNNAFGIVSIITPEVSFCFQSARLYARHTEYEITTANSTITIDLESTGQEK